MILVLILIIVKLATWVVLLRLRESVFLLGSNGFKILEEFERVESLESVYQDHWIDSKMSCCFFLKDYIQLHVNLRKKIYPRKGMTAKGH